MVRRYFILSAIVALLIVGGGGLLWPPLWWALAALLPLIGLGLWQSYQAQHTILRNFPLLGMTRYLLEKFRPEIQQYFIESNTDARPLAREFRAVVYQRAKGELETRPFGTERDVYAIGYEWAAHTVAAREPMPEEPRVSFGGRDCSKPYRGSRLHISAMSFGSLSGPAVRALNRGAANGGFAHNTGEGGIAEYHRHGGDLIWQIGTGYFGCRQLDGSFDLAAYKEMAQDEQVKMIELKLSQGAKPGHGGVLPGVKVTEEIARARGVPAGETVRSPPAHHTFSTPLAMMNFIAELRRHSGGKPVGFKLSIGRRIDLLAMCKAMLETDILPDYIAIDGGEGGTGAAPLEFSNFLGMPARDAWIFLHSALVGVGLRDRIRVVASSKILTGFHMVRALALGADVCASARGMMLALGCIQALRCNTDECPTGVTTQRKSMTHGLHVGDKSRRVTRFHAGTVASFLELVGAMGLADPDDLQPHHIFRRIDDLRIRHFGELYDWLEPGQLLDGHGLPPGIADEWHAACSDRWVTMAEPGPHGGRSHRA